MRDKEEMMSLFEEFENSLDVAENNSSISAPRKKENIKKQQIKTTITKPKTSKETPKKFKEKKGFFAQARKEMQALKRIEAEVKAEQEALKSKIEPEEVLPKKNVSPKETIADKYEKAAEEARKRVEAEKAQKEKRQLEKEALKEEKKKVAEQARQKKAEDKKVKVESNRQQREKKAEERRFNRKFKKTDKAVRKMAKKEAKQAKKQAKRITEPKKRNIFNRLGNIINLNQHEYDIYKEDIKAYKKGKLSEEHIKLEWEEIQDYEDAKSDIKLRAAWGAFKLALAGLGLAAAVNFGGQLLKSTYDWGYGLTEGFWDDTKRNIEENREQYELFHGEYLPNGEKKRQLTAEEYEQLTPEQKKYISYIPSIDAELAEDEDGNITVTFPDNTNKKMTADATQEEDTKDLER